MSPAQLAEAELELEAWIASLQGGAGTVRIFGGSPVCVASVPAEKLRAFLVTCRAAPPPEPPWRCWHCAQKAEKVWQKNRAYCSHCGCEDTIG